MELGRSHRGENSPQYGYDDIEAIPMHRMIGLRIARMFLPSRFTSRLTLPYLPHLLDG